MSGGGGSTTTQKADPWSGIQPSLASLYGNLNNAYNAGQLAPNQNTGQVQPWTQDMYNAYGQALNGGNLATGLTTNLASGNIAGSGNIGAMNLAGLASGQFNGSQGLQQLANGMFNGNAATSGLLSTAMGNGLNINSPALQGAINAAQQPVVQNYQHAVLPGLLSTFSANGRLGSGANMDAIGQSESQLGQTLGNISGSLTGSAYQQALQQQQAAQQSLLGGQIQSGQSLGGIESGAGNALASLQGSALSALPGITSGNLNTSGIYQNYLQSILNSNIAQQNYNAQQPLLGLSNLSGLLQNGMALNGQTSSTQQSKNGFGSALGGAATGATIGSAFGPIGTGVGAVGGLLAGALL